MRKTILIFTIFLAILQGCTNKDNIVFIGESNEWLATVTVTLKDNQYFTNTILKPKNKMNIDYLNYTTTFNDYIFGKSSSELKGNDIAFMETYGDRLFSGGKTNYEITELKKMKYSTITIIWKENGIFSSETIEAYPVK